MIELLPIVGLIFGPIIGAILLAFLQYGIYRGCSAVGLVDREAIPMFPILVFRGLIILLALIAAGAFLAFYLKGDAPDPLSGWIYGPQLSSSIANLLASTTNVR
ncbi:MAG: hypothetical protein EA402_02125 [Planctomycetota bacterium]|nr:MAG: hypothetical protein EA402_02125 [Planctomycetota bacterium]